MRLPMLALALLLAGLPARAADPLTDALGGVYPDYRAALFRTNSGPPEAALAAIRAAEAGWARLGDRLAAPLPEPYAREAGGAALHARVAAILAKAGTEAASGQLPAAHETLEEIRDLLGGFRARNGVFTFSDLMNAYHEEMERAAPLAAEAATKMAELRELAGVLHYLAARLLPGAPASLRADADFAALEAANRAAADAFRGAVRGGDPAAIRQAAGALRQSYSRLFLRFG
jgi:hypothetical protein